MLRRLEFDLIQYYKVLNNLISIEPNSYFHLHYYINHLRPVIQPLQLQYNSLTFILLHIFRLLECIV